LVTIWDNVKKRGRWLYSIKFKLFIAFLAVGLIPLAFLVSTSTSFIENYLVTNNANALMRKANMYADTISRGNLLDETRGSILFTTMRSNALSESFRILVLDTSAFVLMDTGNSSANTYFITSEVIDALNNRTISNVQTDLVSVYTAAPIRRGSEIEGVLVIVSDISGIVSTVSSMSTRLIILASLTATAVLLAVFIVSQILISPMKKILRVINRMSEGHLNQRIETTGHDEFSHLAKAFNNMNKKLEEIEKNREEFVSNVSHELKTPLTSIKVLSESILLEENVPTDMYQEFLKDINSEVDRMTLIVNDLLTLVKLDQRSLGLNIKEVELNKIVDDIIKRLTPLALQRELELIYENTKTIVVEADEMKLSLAISNLVENAIKYTKEGSVKVTIDQDHQNAFITVKDTGIGISEEEQQKIFTRFYRVDKARAREAGGTGLGLSITHSTVLLHEGSIRVNSKDGEGATFVVRIPIHR